MTFALQSTCVRLKMAGKSEDLVGNVLRHFFSLEQEGQCGSVRMLGDLLIANSRPLELCSHGNQFSKVLLSYADSLYSDLQFRRALHFYKEALQVAQTGQDNTTECAPPSVCEVRWRMYQCHMKLKEKQEALDMLTSIPLKQRDSKVALGLGKLYHHFKNESREAKICYKQALSMSPLALEAAIGLLSLGVALSEVVFISRSLHCEEEGGILTPGTWLYSWLEVQAYIARHEYSAYLDNTRCFHGCPHSHTQSLSGAVSKMNFIAQQGFLASAEMNCQLAWCLTKLGRTDTAKDLFASAHAHDPYTLTHMDTYSRLLNHASLLKLTPRLLYASPDHHQPWVAKAWEATKEEPFNTRNRVFLHKANSIEPRNAEMTFLQGFILKAKRESGWLMHFKKTIHLDPTFFEAFESVIEMYRDQSQERVALTLIRTLAKKLPLSRQYYLEGLALSKQNKTKARLALERSIESEGHFEKAVVELAKLYISEKNIAKAIETLTSQLEVRTSANLHCELGDCLVKLSRLPEAEEQFRLALGLEKDHKRARKNLDTTNQLVSGHPAFSNFSDDGEYGGGSDESIPDLSGEHYDQEWI
ncbi:anaphase-promoting complex subunit 7-like isoform X2 [Halichondria panicea]|uniref:anaphase-promoting complex subunit 7-like isoform X2 n=1 Tax=Halichondria panicea TaxID=6063 RepID=UPI00312BBAF6